MTQTSQDSICCESVCEVSSFPYAPRLFGQRCWTWDFNESSVWVVHSFHPSKAPSAMKAHLVWCIAVILKLTRTCLECFHSVNVRFRTVKQNRNNPSFWHYPDRHCNKHSIPSRWPIQYLLDSPSDGIWYSSNWKLLPLIFILSIVSMKSNLN